MKISYYKELDGIRAIAALMIMIFHFFQATGDSGNLMHLIKKIIVFGQTGVSLFFVLSGFLITRILFSTKGKPKYFYNFYVRRSLRIFPLYYGYLFVNYFIISPFVYKSSIPGFDLQIYYWLYLQDFAATFNWSTSGPFHFWSLAVEEHFYMFWPFLIYYINNKKVYVPIIVICVIAFVTRILLLQSGHPVFYFTFCRMDELAIGALLAILELNKKLTPQNANLFLYAFIGILIPSLVIWIFYTNQGNPVIQMTKFFLLSFSYFSFIGYVITVKSDNLIKRLLTTRPLLFTGKISYGLYVYHPIGFGLFMIIFPAQPIAVNLLGGFIFAFVFASVSYYFFEAKFLKLKRFFEYDKPEISI